ncbi:hypothetical protein ABZT17_44525 [Streptomyces sp. NPDC005648]|uniref:hypothetical protein n=1 Tax=Streptomyces sp. NPDC005648 TaxID=3157044 RepID=UPI0033BDCA34
MTVWRRTRWALAGCAAAVALAVTSCQSSATGPPRNPPSTTAVPVVTSVEGLHLPVEAYMLTPYQSVQEDWVRSAAVSACMRGFGLSYPAGVRPVRHGTAENAFTVLFRRYGVTEARSVRVWGYHVPRPGGPAAARAVSPVKGRLPPVVRALLTGVDGSGRRVVRHHGRAVPPGGCLGAPQTPAGTGLDELQGPGTSADGIVAAIKADSFGRSEADPRVEAVVRAWSRCMSARGYRIRDPLHAAAVPSMDAPAPTRAEIARAETDVVCKTRTNLVGTWFAVESAYQRVAIHAHQDELAAVARRRDALAAQIEHLYRSYGGR